MYQRKGATDSGKASALKARLAEKQSRYRKMSQSDATADEQAAAGDGLDEPELNA